MMSSSPSPTISIVSRLHITVNKELIDPVMDTVSFVVWQMTVQFCFDNPHNRLNGRFNCSAGSFPGRPTDPESARNPSRDRSRMHN
jgi:hypothetical protein